jgi:intein/homing endonuclease
MKQSEVGWIAGLLDGEGFVGFNTGGRDPGRPYVIVGNNDLAILQRYHKGLKEMGIEARIRRTGKAFRITLSGSSKIVILLSKVQSNLTGWKRDRAQLVLEACRLGGKMPARLRRREILKEYNRKYRRGAQ